VIATDIASTKARRDFLRDPRPAPHGCHIITNPPFGPRGKTAEAFILTGLARLEPGHVLALLLPADFDSAASRRELFGECPAFASKVVLTRRIVWFERRDGVREAPKENHAWYVWQQPRAAGPPTLRYAP